MLLPCCLQNRVALDVKFGYTLVTCFSSSGNFLSEAGRVVQYPLVVGRGVRAGRGQGPRRADRVHRRGQLGHGLE